MPEDADRTCLTERLHRTRFPAPLPGDSWDHGVPVAYLRELVHYWLRDYDWRTPEAELNEYPQFTTEIDGQNIHFLYVRSSEPDALPLVLTHGWPGSFVEFLDVIGPPTDDVEDRGGHFAALEEPQLLTDDVRTFFRALR